MLSLKHRIIVVWVLVTVFAAGIIAAPTQPISYQGRLTDNLGNPVANGKYNVTFAIYTDSAGGSALWTEEHKVTTSDGLFTALLGSVNTFDPSLFSEFPRYLGITIDTGPEMSPRILMASVPYALNAPGETGGYWTQSGSSIYYNGGNVGIGTSTPSSALEVNGDVTVGKSDGPRLTLKDNLIGQERPRISFSGDYLAIFDGDSTSGHIFSFMNTFGNVRDYDASLRIHGRTTNSWGTFLDLTHDGTNGIISTDVGGITLAPANGSVVLRNGAAGAVDWEIRSTLEQGEGTLIFSNVTDARDAIKIQRDGRVRIGSNDPFFSLSRLAVIESGGFSNAIFAKNSTTPNGVAVNASSNAAVGGAGVRGSASGTNCAGVEGIAYSSSGTGVYGRAEMSGGYAGRFNGPVEVNGDIQVIGTLTKSAGSFRIDHPLDPENKYLQHSFVESPDMKNIYDGVAILSEDGRVTVNLPEWFEALNEDFRYQLTAIGAPGPNLHIAQKITQNQFEIAGGSAGMEVSWQVTGIRRDAYAEAHRIQVEVDKQPEERGRYLYPELFGKPEHMEIEYERRQRLQQSSIR